MAKKISGANFNRENVGKGGGEKHTADFMSHTSLLASLILTWEPFYVCVLMKREILHILTNYVTEAILAACQILSWSCMSEDKCYCFDIIIWSIHSLSLTGTGPGVLQSS